MFLLILSREFKAFFNFKSFKSTPKGYKKLAYFNEQYFTLSHRNKQQVAMPGEAFLIENAERRMKIETLQVFTHHNSHELHLLQSFWPNLSFTELNLALLFVDELCLHLSSVKIFDKNIISFQSFRGIKNKI